MASAQVARCLFPKLELPPETYAPASLARLKRAVLLDEAAPDKAAARAHATRGANKTRQRAALAGDPVVGAVLCALRDRLRRLWRSGKVRTCGHFDAADAPPPPDRGVRWTPDAASALLRARERLTNVR